MAAIGGFPGQDHTHELNVYLGAGAQQPPAADGPTPEELRERGLRDSPVVDVEDAYKRVLPNGGDLLGDTRAVLDRMADKAAYQYARICAGEAAQLIRQAFGERAHRAVFDRSLPDDDGITVDLLAVFDAADEVLWYDREDSDLDWSPFGRRTDEIEAHGGHVIPLLGEDTKNAIERLVELAESSHDDGYLEGSELPGGYPSDPGDDERDYDTDGQVLEMLVQEELDGLHRVGGEPAFDGSQFPQRRVLEPLERDITVRVLRDVLRNGGLTEVRFFPGDQQRLAEVAAVLDPRVSDDEKPFRAHNGYISLDRLAEVLGDETAVLDPEDVPALMETIRAAADTPAGQHRPRGMVPPSDPDDATVQRLVQLAEELGVADEGYLDDRVHDMHSLPASQINNDGFEAQVRYLLPLMGEAELEQEIRSSCV